MAMVLSGSRQGFRKGPIAKPILTGSLPTFLNHRFGRNIIVFSENLLNSKQKHHPTAPLVGFVFVFAKQLMQIFVDKDDIETIMEGVKYLRIEGSFYCGIGCLFLFYGLYRALGKPGMSVILTIISLGTRVALAYLLSMIPSLGVLGIWWSVPIGWILADILGLVYYLVRREKLIPQA